MPAPAAYAPRPMLAQCPACGWYARFIVMRGEGWAVLRCPCCGPVRLAHRHAAPAPPSAPPPHGAPYGRRRR
jgi:uncharacterized Zn finger protein